MPNTTEIALQNDNFRKHLSQGTLVLTQGIRSNTPEDLKEIITKVRTFDTFDANNEIVPVVSFEFADTFVVFKNLDIE